MLELDYKHRPSADVQYCISKKEAMDPVTISVIPIVGYIKLLELTVGHLILLFQTAF